MARFCSYGGIFFIQEVFQIKQVCKTQNDIVSHPLKITSYLR